MYIIESIGDWGVRTTEYDNLRRATPHPGDVVDFGENQDYPFNEARFGRIDSLDNFGTGTISVCCEQGSVFLLKSGNVSISGGPFTSVMPDELVPTYDLRPANFWNWGDHRPAAHQGVYYTITRPVFVLRKRAQADEERVHKAFEEA